MKIGLWLGIVLALVGMMGAPAEAEPRIALVIGNAGYGADLGALISPANDAKLMAETLKKCGFQVTTLLDVDQKMMKRAMVDFGAKLAEAGPSATGLFFFTGHGISIQSRSYLIPIGAEIAKESDVDLEAVTLDVVVQQMEFAGVATGIVIVDASRKNPLAHGFRSASRGLLPLTAMGPNFFIAYSTAPGALAGYDEGANGPYVAALAEAMLTPGLAIQEVFDRARKQVVTVTGLKQVPWESASMTDPFYFLPKN